MRQKTGLQVAFVGLSGLIIASCARQAPPRRPSPPVVVAPPSRPMGAEEYMKVTSSSALLVVRASELAMKRSTNGSTLQLASRLRRDHIGIASQLNMAGRRLNLLPPASMLSLDQAMFDALSRASDFDAAYKRTMRSAVENCASSHGSYVQVGGSPTLRPVARFAASACRAELRLLGSR